MIKDVILDDNDIRMLNFRIKEYGGVKKLIERVLYELDATIIFPDGSRPRQTISYTWKKSNSEFHYLLNKLCDENLTNEEYNNYINRYNKICANNIAFEKENPPIIYDKKKQTRTKTTRIDKVKSMFGSEELNVGEKAVKVKPKKETVAERKAKLLNNKAIKLTFNIVK